MDREHFMLCVRAYYPFARFHEFMPDELDVAQDLPKDYWAEPEKQWLPYYHFIHGLRWDHGKVYIQYVNVKGTPAYQERKLLSYLKQLCTTGFYDGTIFLHNVPPMDIIYPPKRNPPKRKETLFKRMLRRIKSWRH